MHAFSRSTIASRFHGHSVSFQGLHLARGTGNRSYATGLRPLILPDGVSSLLPLVNSASNVIFPSVDLAISNGPFFAKAYAMSQETEAFDHEPLVPFCCRRETSETGLRPTGLLGFLRPAVVGAIAEWTTQSRGFEIHETTRDGTPSISAITLSVGLDSEESHKNCSEPLRRVNRSWRKSGMFYDILRGWSDEEYPVFFPASNQIAFNIERAALPLFGLPNYGSLMTGYFVSERTGETMIWVPRRSRLKRTWPGKLDVTVGGGIGKGDAPLSAIIRECAEEASLDAKYVSRNIQSVGTLQFPNRSPSGWLLPGLYYLYELPLPADGSVRPAINAADGEVEEFELMSAQQVLDSLARNEFKASSAMALVHFLIRHRLFKSEADPNFSAVYLGLARKINTLLSESLPFDRH